MQNKILATANVFLDTSYAIALSSIQDRFHEKALYLAEEIEATSVKLITTQAIFLEIGNALSSIKYRQQAGLLLKALETDGSIEVIPLTDFLYEQAFQLFNKHTDKAWGMTDCISFVVMRERGLTEALTADHHFEQAGFRALLRQPFISS